MTEEAETAKIEAARVAAEAADAQMDEHSQAEAWRYYRDFVKAHGARGITDLVVQRDSLVAALREISSICADYRESDFQYAVREIADKALDKT